MKSSKKNLLRRVAAPQNKNQFKRKPGNQNTKSKQIGTIRSNEMVERGARLSHDEREQNAGKRWKSWTEKNDWELNKNKNLSETVVLFFSFRVPSFSVWTSFSNQPNLKKKRETSEIGHQNSVNVGKLNLKAVPILVKKWFHKSKKNTSDAIWHRCFHREWKTIIPCSLCVPYLMDIVVWKQKKPKGDVFFGLGAVDESSWAERERRRSRDQSQHDSDSTKRKKRSCTMLHKSPTSRVRSKNKPQPSPVPSLVSPKKKLGKT